MVFRKLVTYGEETSYGQTPADVSRWIGGVTSFSGGVEPVSEEVPTISGARVFQTLVHGLDVSPSIEFYVQNPRIIKYAFGKATNTGSSPPYTHLLEIKEDYELPSITLVEHRLGVGGHGYVYNGCRVDKLSLSWEEDSFLKASMDFKATRVAKTTTLPTPEEETKGFYSSSSKTVEINGVEIGYVVSGSVTLSNNTVAFPRQGDFHQKHVAGNAQLEAELELYYLDSSIVDLMIGKTRFDVKVRFSRGSDDYLEVRLDGCVCGVESVLEAEGDMMQTVSLKPSNMSILVVDDVEAY
ncbi:MAG: phage tail tube protein [Candidatus Caldarchaeum sp.]